jgi:hypothetical protein
MLHHQSRNRRRAADLRWIVRHLGFPVSVGGGERFVVAIRVGSSRRTDHNDVRSEHVRQFPAFATSGVWIPHVGATNPGSELPGSRGRKPHLVPKSRRITRAEVNHVAP